MKKLRNIILIVCIIIVVVIILLIANGIIRVQKEIELDEQGDIGEEINFDSEELEEENENIRFYTVKNCIETYFNSVNMGKEAYYETDENNETKFVANQEYLNQEIYKLLSDEYIQKNNITEDNLLQYIQLTENANIIIPLEMRVLKKDIVYKYIVYGIKQDVETKETEEIYIIVNIDNENKTFSIEPITDTEVNDIEDIKIVNDNQEIENKEINHFTDEKISNEYIVQEYVEAYRILALSFPEYAYELLDEEFRNNRFGSLEEYEQYIQKNEEEISLLQCKKYLVNNQTDYTEYVCLDQNQNYLIFKSTGPMNFKMELDTYTLETDEFITEYDEGNDKNKVLLNIDKWVKMLNNRDYTSAYNVLDETFRNNNFGTEENFENTIRQTLPLHYKTEYSDYTEENGTHVVTIILSDITGETEETKQLSIIMQLKEDRNFVMSFSFN